MKSPECISMLRLGIFLALVGISLSLSLSLSRSLARFLRCANFFSFLFVPLQVIIIFFWHLHYFASAIWKCFGKFSRINRPAHSAKICFWHCRWCMVLICGRWEAFSLVDQEIDRGSRLNCIVFCVYKCYFIIACHDCVWNTVFDGVRFRVSRH